LSLIAFTVAGALADGVHNHGRQGRARPVAGRRQQPRRGREEELAAYENGQVREDFFNPMNLPEEIFI